MSRNTPQFASKIRTMLKEAKLTQRQLALLTDITPSVVNRLCKTGLGAEKDICLILQHLKLKRRKILEILTDRRAELSEEPAKSIWNHFRYAFKDENEYLEELSPVPIQIAYACTQEGISLKKTEKLIKQLGIKEVKDFKELSVGDMFKLKGAAVGVFGQDKVQRLFHNIEKNNIMPVLFLDFYQAISADQFIDLDGCNGKLLFGIPHMVMGTYHFIQNRGKILAHHHHYGIEYLYAIEGEYELEYDGTLYPSQLKPDGSIFLYNANKPHAITLAVGDSGRLLMARYYPTRRWPKALKEVFNS